MKSLWAGMKNVMLWSYGRGSWQYDVLCLLIVGAIFLLPGRFFGDRDRGNPAGPAASNEARLIPLEIPEDEMQALLRRQGAGAEALSDAREACRLYARDHFRAEVTPERFGVDRDAKGRLVYRCWYIMR